MTGRPIDGDCCSRRGRDRVTLPFNLGVGGAMKTGFTYAQRHGYARAIQVDADGQHNPADIARVLAGLEPADIAIGARFAEVGDYEVRGPRRWAMVFLAAVVSRVAKTTLTDVTSGFRAANARAIDQYVRYYPAEYLGDTIDSLVEAAPCGAVGDPGARGDAAASSRQTEPEPVRVPRCTCCARFSPSRSR